MQNYLLYATPCNVIGSGIHQPCIIIEREGDRNVKRRCYVTAFFVAFDTRVTVNACCRELGCFLLFVVVIVFHFINSYPVCFALAAVGPKRVLAGHDSSFTE